VGTKYGFKFPFQQIKFSAYLTKYFRNRSMYARTHTHTRVWSCCVWLRGVLNHNTKYLRLVTLFHWKIIDSHMNGISAFYSCTLHTSIHTYLYVILRVFRYVYLLLPFWVTCLFFTIFLILFFFNIFFFISFYFSLSSHVH